jgi:sporulation protein YunB
MDRIYSRKRIKLPKIEFKNRYNKENFNKKAKFIKGLIILIIAVTVAILIVNAIEPIIDAQCEVKAKAIATKISNEQVSIVMKDYKYEDLCTVIKDEFENVKMIKSNIILINEIISDVALRVQDELNKVDSENMDIRLGTFTGSKFLSGRGPKVNFKISTIGNVETDLKSEFISAGINQTSHRVYLQVKCKVVILTPFNQVEEEIENQVLIAEAVILGDVPSSYYNFDGVKEDNLIDVVE